jgi:group I intron endonuclease
MSNGKVYIGKSFRCFGLREEEHFKFALQGKNYCPHFYNAIRVHGREGFKISLLSGYASSREDLSSQEKFYIAKYRSNETTFGYNLTSGGEGADYWRGKKRSEKDRQKMRAAKLGIKQSPETIAKRSLAMHGNTNCLGRKQSFEERKMRSLASPKSMLGKHHSQETKNKISISVSSAIQGENNPFFGKHHSDKTCEKLSVQRQGVVPGCQRIAARSVSGTAWVYNPETQYSKRISQEEQPLYSLNGWISGRGPRASEAAKKRGVPMEHIRLMVERRLAKKVAHAQ